MKGGQEEKEEVNKVGTNIMGKKKIISVTPNLPALSPSRRSACVGEPAKTRPGSSLSAGIADPGTMRVNAGRTGARRGRAEESRCENMTHNSTHPLEDETSRLVDYPNRVYSLGEPRRRRH